MALNYDEAIAELRAEENRLENELTQIRAAIPAMIVLRNRNTHIEGSQQKAAERLLPGIGKYSGMGATEAISVFLRENRATLNTREIYDRLSAGGWTTNALKPIGVISATLIQLEKKGIAERVGESWRIKTNLQRASLNPAVFSPSASQQPS